MDYHLPKKLSILLCTLTLSFNSVLMAKSGTPSTETQREQLNAIAHRYEQDYFAHFPELGLIMGKQDVALDHFMDHGYLNYAVWEVREDEFLSSLKQIDAKALKGTPEYITYRLLKETLENNRAARICQENLWNVSPTYTGWHMFSTRVAEKQPVGTPEYRQQAIKRWSQFSQVATDEINNLKLGVSQGYLAPKAAVNIVLKQLHMILDKSPENSPYFNMALRDGDEEFKATMAEIIRTEIHPALERYATYLETVYLPLAREEIGVSALPHGIACYNAKVKQETTLTLSPKQIYSFGFKHLEELNAEVAEIGMKEFGLDKMKDIFYAAKTRPEYLFKSEEDILSYNYAALARAKAKMADWFGIIPHSDAIIQPYPEYRAKTGASGEYTPPSEDGTKPGTYYINTYNPTARSRVDQEAILFHELIPGHHLQVALSYEDKAQHSLNKYLWNSGFGEGWGLYAERVADEMNLYTDNISRIGMLANESLRTTRLIVDTGIHVFSWTREEAIQFMKDSTALSDFIIEGEVDRYIANPGQATAYMLGKREIELLRHLAQDKMGSEFNIREFHKQVLQNGAVSLPLLKELIKDWVAKA